RLAEIDARVLQENPGRSHQAGGKVGLQCPCSDHARRVGRQVPDEIVTQVVMEQPRDHHERYHGEGTGQPGRARPTKQYLTDLLSETLEGMSLKEASPQSCRRRALVPGRLSGPMRPKGPPASQA